MNIALRTACCLAAGWAVLSFAGEAFRRADFEAKSDFELVVDKSKYLRPGATRISGKSAYVTLAHGLNPGNADGLEVLFFERPITQADLPDLESNDGKAMRRASYAAMVLYLDKERRVSQVNLSYVVPGTAVAQTIAWKPDELKRYFSNVKFANGRLALKTAGSYSEREPSKSIYTLGWNVDLDLPVKREIRR